MHACIRNDSYMIRCDSCWLIHPWLISVGNNRTLIPRWCLFHTRFRGWFAPMSLVTPTPTFGSDLQSWRIHGNHSKAELLGCSSTHAPSIAEMAKMRRHTLGCGWRQWNHNCLKVCKAKNAGMNVPRAHNKTHWLLRCFHLCSRIIWTLLYFEHVTL